MKIHQTIIASLITILSGTLLVAQDDEPFADMVPVTFDDRPAADYFFRDFGPEPAEGEAPFTSVVADPDDASNMVAQTIRQAGAQTWSGVTFMQGDGNVLPGLNNGTELKMSARVRAPGAGIPVLLKAESSITGDPPAIFMEKLAHTTKADEWEILTFDFSQPTNSNFNPDFDPFLDRLVLFFNFGAGSAPEQTYYFDDVKFGAPEFLNLPFDFESDTLEYSFTNFEGGVATLIDNPQMNDANPSAKVGQMVKDGGQPWAGTTVATDGPINFGIHTRIAMDVYSPAAGKTVKFKLEPSMGEAEVDVMTTVANEWETLVFDFTEKLPGEFTNFSLFFGFGEVGDGSAAHTYLFDNIRSAPAPVVHPELPLTFEDDALSYNFNNFDGGVAERIENPDMSGINTSGHVARMVKNAGQVWGGADILIGEDLDFSESTIFKMKVWSPRVGVPVLLKLEKGEEPPNTQFIEQTATTTVANTWEELSYDFTGMTPADGSLDGLNKLVLIFENGTAGDGSANWTFYFDDVYMEGMGIPLNPVDLPVTFEEDNVDFNFIAFGNMGATEIVEDPTDASNKVARAVRLDNAETWAGTTVGSGEAAALANAIPFSDTATQLSMRVYSPAAAIPIRLKVEDKTNPAISVETEAVTTMANAWETLVFDFGEPAEGTSTLSLDNTYDKLSIFFNFGTAGAAAGEQTFYYDDIEFTGMTRGGIGGPMKIDLPITFSGSPDEIDYTLTDFGGAVTILGADPVDPANVVATTQKGPGAETWAGTTMSTPSGLKSPIPFTSDSTQISVRIYSPAAGIPVLLKVEELGRTDNVGMEVIRNTTVANEWETLVWDYSESVEGQFSTPLDLTATYQKISIFFNFGVTGDDGGELIFHWDDVIFLDNTPRAVGEEAGSSTITLTMDPTPSVTVGKLVFLDDGTEIGKIASIAGRVLTLEAPLAVAIAADSRLTFVTPAPTFEIETGGNVVNISTRGLVGNGDEAMIGGFIVFDANQTVVVFAKASADLPASLANKLEDAFLTIENQATGEVIMENDDWDDDPEQAQLIADLWGGTAPLVPGSTSSGAVLTVPAGNWTARVNAADGTTSGGIAQVEVYEVQP